MLEPAIKRLAPRLPRLALGPAARRLIGGETLEQACELSARLNGEGKHVTLGLLAENVDSERQARAVAAEERRTLEEIEARRIDATLSVKLSALGLAVNEELCLELLTALVTAAAEKENAVLIDMEQSSATDATLRLYRHLYEQGHGNVSLALQARLQRTLNDVEALAPLAPRVSICKGGYEEPHELLVQPGQVRERFMRAVSRLADSAAMIGISTHDSDLIGDCRRLLALAGRRSGDYEIQMLLGVAPRLEDELVRSGESLRVYVPYGGDWHPYVVRRLRR